VFKVRRADMKDAQQKERLLSDKETFRRLLENYNDVSGGKGEAFIVVDSDFSGAVSRAIELIDKELDTL
jgi:hypothetical protein